MNDAPELRPDLDDVDRQIIRGLVADGRATYAALSELTGLSQAAVRARVQRLLDEHVIGIAGRVAPSVRGIGVHAMAAMSVAGPARSIAAAVCAIPSTSFVVTAAGRFGVMAELQGADNADLLEGLDQMRSIDGVTAVESFTYLYSAKQDWSGVGRIVASGSWVDPAKPAIELDDADHLLIRELMKDGRATYAALAPKVDLSQAAVRVRVQRLLETGVVAVQASPIADAVGIAGFAIVGVLTFGNTRGVASSVAELAESTMVIGSTGRFDVIFELWYDDRAHLLETLDRVREHPDVAGLECFPYLRIEKNLYEVR